MTTEAAIPAVDRPARHVPTKPADKAKPAALGRVLAGGLSLSATFGLVTVMALANPDSSSASTEEEGASDARAGESEGAAQPVSESPVTQPETIIVIRRSVAGDADAGSQSAGTAGEPLAGPSTTSPSTSTRAPASRSSSQSSSATQRAAASSATRSAAAAASSPSATRSSGGSSTGSQTAPAPASVATPSPVAAPRPAPRPTPTTKTKAS